MAQEPIIKVDGSEIPRILEVNYQIRAAVDRDGRPTRRLLFDGIRIRRIGDAKKTLADWAKDPKEGNRKGGEIEFRSNEGKPIRKLTWKNGYVHEYDLRYDPLADHVVESVTIMAEEINSGGMKVHLDWAGTKNA